MSDSTSGGKKDPLSSETLGEGGYLLGFKQGRETDALAGDISRDVVRKDLFLKLVGRRRGAG